MATGWLDLLQCRRASGGKRRNPRLAGRRFLFESPKLPREKWFAAPLNALARVLIPARLSRSGPGVVESPAIAGNSSLEERRLADSPPVVALNHFFGEPGDIAHAINDQVRHSINALLP